MPKYVSLWRFIFGPQQEKKRISLYDSISALMYKQQEAIIQRAEKALENGNVHYQRKRPAAEEESSWPHKHCQLSNDTSASVEVAIEVDIDGEVTSSECY